MACSPKADPFMVSVKKETVKMGFGPCARLRAGIVKSIAEPPGSCQEQRSLAISTKTAEFEMIFAK